MLKGFFGILLFVIYSFGFDNVSIQLKWRNSFQFAGFYMAKEKGFYKDVGLDVEIKELKPNQRVVLADEILKGNSTYGVYDSELIYRIIIGEPIELLMPIFEHSPLVLVSLHPEVKTLKDIRDKNVTISKYAVRNPTIISMFKTQGIDVKELNVKALNYNLSNFLKHKAAYSLYETDELYTLEKEKVNYRLFRPIDYGFDFYGDILFTSKRELKEHPKRVENFVKASKKGWKYAINHIEETINTILSKYNTQNLSYDKLKDEANRTKDFISKDFRFDYKKLQTITDIYILLNLVEVKQNIKDSIYEPTSLSEEEKKFIQSHIFKCISTAKWAPFNTYDNGKLVGIAVDYWKKIKERLQLKSECIVSDKWIDVLNSIKEKKADITISTGITEERLKYALFSNPYVSFPIAIATKNDIDFIADMSFLEGRKIAIAKHYTVENIIKKYYPDINIVETEDIKEALDLVEEGKVYAAIDILPVLAYMISQEYISTLKISGKTPYNFDVRVMVRKDYKKLIPAINKAIETISLDEKKEIYNKWITVVYQKGYTFRQILLFLVIGLALLSIVFIWIYILKKEILKRKRLEEELKILATRDKLTQIYNRHMMDLSLKEQLEIAKRYHKNFGVIFLDIDFFKKVNDTYGHKVGDLVLQELSTVIKNTIRKSDILGRWGGEEFLIILPEATKIESVRLANKLREIIRKHKFKIVGKLTCSFGVTSYIEGDSVDSMIKRVDSKLYQAKKEGRDRVVF